MFCRYDKSTEDEMQVIWQSWFICVKLNKKLPNCLKIRWKVQNMTHVLHDILSDWDTKFLWLTSLIELGQSQDKQDQGLEKMQWENEQVHLQVNFFHNTSVFYEVLPLFLKLENLTRDAVISMKIRFILGTPNTTSYICEQTDIRRFQQIKIFS